MINNKVFQIRLPERLFNEWQQKIPDKLASKVLRMFMRRALAIIRKHPKTLIWIISGEYEIVPTKRK